MDIRIIVTPERFDEIFSLEDWINFDQLTSKEAYGYMVQFVVDKDGNPVPADKARQMFKKVPKREWPKYLTMFIKGVRDAFVNPTNGSGSASPPKAKEPKPLPSGSQS